MQRTSLHVHPCYSGLVDDPEDVEDPENDVLADILTNDPEHVELVNALRDNELVYESLRNVQVSLRCDDIVLPRGAAESELMIVLGPYFFLLSLDS